MTPLERKIEDDLDWRFEELASLRAQIVRQIPHSPAYKTLLRAAWALLYAHYEGFCKFAITNVCMEGIVLAQPLRSMCKETILSLSLEKEIKAFRGDTSTGACLDFFANRFSSLLASPVEFERNRENEYVIKGDCNLWPHLLAENCEALCIPRTHVDLCKERLWILVDRRNKIAHGRNAVVKDLPEYEEYERAVTGVMVDLALNIIDLIDGKRYLKDDCDYEI